MFPASRGLLGAFAALLAVAVSPLQAASDSAIARGKLDAELQPAVTLSKASVDQTAAAIKSAVAKDPGMATSILAAGIIARLPKQNRGQISCEDVAKMTRAAIASAPNQASQLVQKASSIVPDCADTLNSLIGSIGGDDLSFLFAIGIGIPGFPGSPGFVGSAPSGSFAFPPLASPSPSPMTPVN